MSNKEQNKLKKLIIENIEASKYIANNYGETVRQIRRDFRDAIMSQLKAKLLAEDKLVYAINAGGEIKSTNAPVWIKQNEADKIYFGLEPFSGNRKSFSSGILFIGVCADSKQHKFETYDSRFGKTDFWHKTQLIFDEKEQELNLENPELLKKISDRESDSFKKLVSHIVKQCYNFIQKNKLESDKN